jgi:hypothetical protein
MVRLLRLLSAAALPEPILAGGCGGRGGPHHHATANRGFTPYFYAMVITTAFQTGSIPGQKNLPRPERRGRVVRQRDAMSQKVNFPLS